MEIEARQLQTVVKLHIFNLKAIFKLKAIAS